MTGPTVACRTPRNPGEANLYQVKTSDSKTAETQH